MYCHIALPLHIQITKTRNYQLPHQAAAPGFPCSARSTTSGPSPRCDVSNHLRLPFAAPPTPGPPLDAAVVCPCVVLSFSISWATPQPNGFPIVGQGPLGIPESLSGCRGPVSLSLTSVQWSFGRPHVV